MNEPNALLARAHAAKFKLEQATADMNEILEEFRVLCCARFRVSAIVDIDDGDLGGCGFVFAPCVEPAKGELFAAGLVLRSAPRELRIAALGAMPMLWERLLVAARGRE